MLPGSFSRDRLHFASRSPFRAYRRLYLSQAAIDEQLDAGLLRLSDTALRMAKMTAEPRFKIRPGGTEDKCAGVGAGIVVTERSCELMTAVINAISASASVRRGFKNGLMRLPESEIVNFVKSQIVQCPVGKSTSPAIRKEAPRPQDHDTQDSGNRRGSDKAESVANMAWRTIRKTQVSARIILALYDHSPTSRRPEIRPKL